MDDLRQTVLMKLADPALQAALRKALVQARERSAESLTELADVDAARDAAGRERRECVDMLGENLVLLERRLAEAGTVVLFAPTAAEAASLVVRIARQHQVRHAVLSKSMVAEEVGIEAALHNFGIIPTQTDLGERVVQLARQKPSHITAPCLHMSASEIARLLEARAGLAYTESPEKLTRFLSRQMRPAFLQAGMGISGANFLVAETGQIVVLENEGNARLGCTLPKVHVVVAGIDKVVRTRAQAQLLLALLPRLATGQRATAYTSFLAAAPLPGQTRYVVLVDNHRSDLFNAGPFRDLLRCIRCGSCLNVCPVYERIGGHAYGWTYAGPIGIALAAFMAPPEVAGQVTMLCALCGACAQTCPVRIPLDRLILLARARGRTLRTREAVRTERRLLRRVTFWMVGPLRYRASHLLHRLGQRWFPERLMEVQRALGWSLDREAPGPVPVLLRRRLKGRRRDVP